MIGGISALMGYCSRSEERSIGAGLVAYGNGLCVGLGASLLASRHADCDPVWLVLGALVLGWPTGFVGVVRTMGWAWSAKENLLSFLDAWNDIRQAQKMRKGGSRPTQPSLNQPTPDDDSNSKQLG